MITREYVTLFLVGSCFLLDYSSQIPLQAQLLRGTKAGVMPARGVTLVTAPLGEVAPGRTRLRRHGRSRMQRIKRGWVWNQFFVLEEYMGSDPQYVGKVREIFWLEPHSLQVVLPLVPLWPLLKVNTREKNPQTFDAKGSHNSCFIL